MDASCGFMHFGDQSLALALSSCVRIYSSLVYCSSQNYYRQSCYSWEFISPKLPFPLPSWNSDESIQLPQPLPSWRLQSPLHFHWFPITILKLIWINFHLIAVTVTVLKCFRIRIGRALKEAYSPRGRSRRLLKTPFSEPLLRTLLRTLCYCKTHSRPPSQKSSESPSPEPFPEPSQNPS